ncbi:MAG: hypothetical protein JWM11_7874 [Planctomycetaceae bacterium]|nr:hypothetical protein [Planctomycetaceae bacterium]
MISRPHSSNSQASAPWYDNCLNDLEMMPSVSAGDRCRWRQEGDLSGEDCPMSNLKLGRIGVLAFALSLIGLVGFAAQKTAQIQPAVHSEHSEMMLTCAKACSDCQRACDSCSTHCARMSNEGQKEHLSSLMSCQDCATVCAAASQIVSRGGPFSNLICTACADACGRCAKECEKFPNDKHMKSCAEECHKCEKACQSMTKHMASSK